MGSKYPQHSILAKNVMRYALVKYELQTGITIYPIDSNIKVPHLCGIY